MALMAWMWSIVEMPLRKPIGPLAVGRLVGAVGGLLVLPCTAYIPITLDADRPVIFLAHTVPFLLYLCQLR